MMAENKGRKDLRYIGHVEADIQFEGLKGGSWMFPQSRYPLG